MRQCALRELWAASRTPPLLPLTPAARLGSVAHQLLEEAGRGDFSTAATGSIERRWEELVLDAEGAASANWLDRHLLPLSAAIPDFEVRRLQALSAAHALAAEVSVIADVAGPPNARHVGCEVPVSTPDGLARGRIDAVTPSNGGVVVKDYKSGAIYGHGADREVKPEYAVQLKLYAAMYAAMTGTWPVRLEVVPISGSPESIPFSPDECEQLMTEALNLRARINSVVTSELPLPSREHNLASPAPSVCTYCAYRPQCAPYDDARLTDPEAGWPRDLSGVLMERRTLGNGRLFLLLKGESTTFQIRGLDPSATRHPAVARATVGDTISAFNLRPGGSGTTFKEGPFTVFYVVAADNRLDDSNGV